MGRTVILLLLAGCTPDQEPVRTVAAVEIPLRSDADRRNLVAIFQRHATPNGLHVDDVSERWRTFEAEANAIAPEDRGTVYIGLWRGDDDDENEALADDRFHPGRIWVTFPRGLQPDRSTRVRVPLLADIRRHWPEARPLPILPDGGLPLPDDLAMTDQGYRIVRSAGPRYNLPATSPMLARP